LLGTLRRTLGGSATFARLLGCEPARSSNAFDGSIGQTLPGFRVVDAEPGHRLPPRGRHPVPPHRPPFVPADEWLRPGTDRACPGVRGWLYRTAVIRTRAHALITRRMLRRIARRA